MYLSKITLNARDCSNYQIYDAYSVHRVVYDLFDKSLIDTEGRFLYADKGPRHGGREILTLSKFPPQNNLPISISTRVIPDHFFDAQSYQFEVLLNPTKKEKATGNRRAITGLLPLAKWFTEHAEKWGFSADESRLEAYTRETVNFEKGGQKYTFNAVLFKGVLTVTNKDLFIQNFMAGLGSGKAFGFGLLQLNPIS